MTRYAALVLVILGVLAPFAEAHGVPAEDRASTLMLHHLPMVAKARAFADVAGSLRPDGTFYIVDIGPLRSRVLALE